MSLRNTKVILQHFFYVFMCSFFFNNVVAEEGFISSSSHFSKLYLLAQCSRNSSSIRSSFFMTICVFILFNLIPWMNVGISRNLIHPHFSYTSNNGWLWHGNVRPIIASTLQPQTQMYESSYANSTFVFGNFMYLRIF